MKQRCEELVEKIPINPTNVKLLYKEVGAKSNVESNRSAKHPQVETDDKQVAETDMEYRRHTLSVSGNLFFVNSLQETLCTVKLNQTEPAWDSPNAVISGDFRNFGILTQTD